MMQQPVNNIYLVSSAVMDMFRELNALDTIGFSAQKAENWYVEGQRPRWKTVTFCMPASTAALITNC